MTPEANLLVACCRRFVRGRVTDKLQDKVRGVNWDAAIELAQTHSLMPVLYWSLNQDCPSAIPETLRARFEVNTRKNLTRTAELLKLLALLEADRIQAIPLKGPLLAAQVYGDIGLRAFSDLDLLIHRADVPRAQKILIGNGYRLNWDLHWSADNAHLRIKERQLSFVRCEGSILGAIAVDLHWGLLPEGCGAAAAPETVWRTLQAVPFCGRTVPALSPENLLLYLCAHGGKHLWERLGWICDVAKLVEARPDMNWSGALAGAASLNAERMLLVGLLLASEVAGAELPDGVRRQIRSNVPVERLAGDIRDRLFTNALSRSALQAFQLNLRMIQGVFNKIRYCVGIVVTPGEAEWRVLRLPPWLYPLYYPLRLGRMISRYAWPGRR